MGLDATKPVLGVSDKARLNQSSQLRRLASKLKLALVASLDVILSKKGITSIGTG